MNILIRTKITPGEEPECTLLNKNLEDSEAFKEAFERQYDIASYFIWLNDIKRSSFVDEVSPRSTELLASLFGQRDCPPYQQGDYERIHSIYNVLMKPVPDEQKTYVFVVEYD
jgi:hypothetical protein